MARRAQSLVEFTVCLPFLLLLLGAMADFGWNLHRQQLLTGVAREAAMTMAGRPAPDPVGVVRIRRDLAFAGAGVGLVLDGIAVGPAPESPGFWAVELRVPRIEISPVGWAPGDNGWVEVRLLTPVGGNP